MTNRRQFLQLASAATATLSFAPTLMADKTVGGGDPPFKISLAEWSIHRTLRDKTKDLTNLDFPALSKEEFGIDAIEYVNQFFKDKANDEKYLADLKGRCDDLGVKSLIIMCDGEGDLGNPDDKARTKAVENHYRWIEIAKG